VSIVIDNEKGAKVGRLLYHSFATVGIHGHKDMPEDITPTGVERGSLEHVLFITLTVSIDYQRDAPSLWKVSRQTFQDPETRYLFDPGQLHQITFQKIAKDMQKYKLSKKPEKDANIWRIVAFTFHDKWKDNPRNFLRDCSWNSLAILNRLGNDTHLHDGKSVSDYPYLRGPKIGPLWLRMLRDNVGISELKNLDKVPIPVDIHVARATLAIGVVRGYFEGRLEQLFEYIRKAWFVSTEALDLEARPMIALDVDEPLWHLSKYGCTKRNDISGFCPVRQSCEAKEYCVEGKVRIGNGLVEFET